ncbi:MAG: two-partner secretion domain-containing protein, partial [Planctomycetota bacterium]
MKLLRKLSNRQFNRQIIASVLAYVLFLNTFVSVTIAGPEGAQVVNGQVSIQQSGSNTAITASDKAIINYSSFDIARPETVQFIQPGSNASVLNRILSANPTNINGTLTANGRVFFVNPAGVYIGDGATINVNQLVASGLNISNADFINGNYNFTGGNGAVINDGDISAEQVYLIGKQVTNSGNINCPAGYVVMAAGDRVFIGEPGSDIILDVEGTSLSEPADTTPSEVGVLNEGKIDAAGGIIALAAAGDIYSQAISNVGTLSTSADAGDAGQIKLAAAEGTVINSGSIEATSESGTGGTVQMLGDKVGLLDAAEIDVSGSDGGGTVLVGGDYQGGADIPTASRTYVSENSTIKADATENGDGGKVIVWADELTGFYGSISARGGNDGGDGGFVEVSGKENLGFYGSVDTFAPNGNIGTLLLDPTNIVVSDADGTDGASGGDILFADTPTAEPWNVTPAQLNTVAADITLQADEDITFTDSVSLTTDGAGITAQAGDDILINASITTQGGSLDFTSNDNSNSTASGDGSIVLNAALDTTANSQTGGAVTLTVDGGTGDIQLGNNITTNTANITLEGPVTLTADSALSTTAAVGGDISFDSDVSGDYLLSLTAGTGNIDLSTVGGTTPLSGLLVNSAATVDLDNTVALDDQGLDITAGTVGIDNTVTTTTGGAVNIANSGVLTVASGANMNLDGAFDQDGVGAVSTAGNITTTADDIKFDTEVTLTGDVSLNTGAGIGDIEFASDV